MTPEQAELFPDICRVEMCPHGIPENEHCVECMEYMDEFNAECERAWEAYDFVETSTGHDFDGLTYSQPDDRQRLNSQLHRVFDYMKPGAWHTLAEIATAVGGSENGVSARLRDFRKPRFGGHTVERRRVAGGVFEYRLIPNGELK
jgi:hypothetical protein